MSGCNGWTNYETWCVKMWMSNDSSEEMQWYAECEELMQEMEGESSKKIVWALGKKLKDYYEKSMPELEGVWSDLLSAALGECNWDEIASHIVDELVTEG